MNFSPLVNPLVNRDRIIFKKYKEISFLNGSVASAEQPSPTAQLLSVIFFHRLTFAAGKPSLDVNSASTGIVTVATVAIAPVIGEAHSTEAPIHKDITGDGAKLRQSQQEES